MKSRYSDRVGFKLLIGIIIASFNMTMTAGSFADSTTATLANQPIPSVYFGLNVNNPVDWPSVSFGSLRLWDDGTNWGDIETQRGSYNWATLDTWVALGQSHKVNLIYTFGRPPAWASLTGGNNVPPSNITYWDDFVTALVTRYKGRIQYYEGWNEPDNPNFYTGSMAELVTLQQHEYNIIHKIDPAAKVSTPPPVTNPPAFYNQFFQAGGGNYCDLVSFHAYTKAAEDVVSMATRAHTAMKSYGQDSKELWATEGGWGEDTNLPDQNLQADFLVKDYLLLWSSGVKRFYWYGWDFKTWGTLWNPALGGIQKPGEAYGDILQGKLVQSSLITPCSSDSNGTWTCGYQGVQGRKGLVVWNSTQTTTFIVPDGYVNERAAGVDYSVSGGDKIKVGTEPELLTT